MHDAPGTRRLHRIYGPTGRIAEGLPVCTDFPWHRTGTAADLLSIRIESDSEFLRKSIKNSGIRSRYRGTVIGIERDNLPIPNPDIETIIQKGDMIWVLGSQRMAEALIKGGVLKHK